jgi:hypothetical protein
LGILFSSFLCTCAFKLHAIEKKCLWNYELNSVYRNINTSYCYTFHFLHFTNQNALSLIEHSLLIFWYAECMYRHTTLLASTSVYREG